MKARVLKSCVLNRHEQVWQSNIPFVQKLYLNLFFFGTRLFATHIVSFVFYCSLVPITVVSVTSMLARVCCEDMLEALAPLFAVAIVIMMSLFCRVPSV